MCGMVCCGCVCVGSENNSVYVYSKHVSKPMLTYKFNVSTSLMVRHLSYGVSDWICFVVMTIHFVAG